jgi:aubergine-like protein
VKSVEEHEGGLMLLLDVSHRVLSQKTVLEFMRECVQKSANWKDLAKKGIIGNIVLTRYNNKSYRVDDIDFDQKPTNTFKKGDKDVSYADYYKNEYNITISDMKQPMLISRKEVRMSGEKEKREFVVCLAPELCNLTGLSDDMRSNYTIMKDLATYTKLTPLQRVDAYKKYISNIANNQKASDLLAGWGLCLEKEPTKVVARLLDEETVIFGNDKACKVGPQADFGRHATSNVVLEPKDIQHWILMYVNKDLKTAEAFDEMIKKVCGPTGIRCGQPRRVELPNDRSETYVNEIRKQLNDGRIQMVVIIFPTLRDDRYAAVKKVLCSEIPCPSQCINSKTLRNDSKNRSIVQKILLQMNCKLGGSLWGIKIPLKDTMIIGIDTYHEANHKGLTVGGFVATVNASFTKYYSKPAIQQKREELINGLVLSMTNALEHYKTVNSSLPERIIIYRDGKCVDSVLLVT